MNIWKRALCSFLTVTMLFSSMPFYAFADAIDEENGTSDEYVVEPGPEEENALAVSDDGAVDMETFLAEDVPDETIAAYSIEDCTPSIEINAQNVICEQDEYVELSVIATVTNLGECTYQWYEIIDDTFCLIEGENSPQYSPSTSAPGIRYYYCEVTNRVDAQQYQASSSTCAITVKEQPEDYIAMQDSVDDEVDYTPSITTQPASANCAQGDDVTLSVTATAVEGGVLSYQWYEVSGETKTAIDGATEASYKPSTAEAGEKSYFCEVTNTYKNKTYTATSETVTVSVEAQKVELIKNIQILATNYSTNPSDNLDMLDGKFDRSQTEYEGITVTDAGFKVYLWPNEEVQSKINYTIFYNDVAGTGVADSNSISVGTSGVPVPFSFNGAILSQNRETKVDIQLSTTDSNGNVTSETYTFHVTFLRGLQTLQAKADGSRLTLTPSTPLQNNALVNEFQGEIAKGLESVSLKIKAQSSEAAVYVGGKAFTSSSFADVSLAEYITEAGDYAIIPIQLKWPVSNPTQTREYTLKLKLVDYTPSITAQPASANCAQGDDVTLSVTATAVEGGVLSYQWYEVSGETKTAIDGATEASYKPSTAEVGEKSYFCEVTNTYKNKTYTATSETAIVTVWSVNPPQFTLQPEDITCNVNDPASLFVEISAPEAGTARLQWFRDGNLLTMGDFIKVDTSKVGKFTYYCVISWELNGKYYKIKSETAVVTVTDEPLTNKNPTPRITVNPQSVSCDKDDTPELSVEYEIDESVLGEITYQWYFGSANVLIPGATSKTYTPETYSNRTKSYYCRITNTYNGRKYTVQSDAARVYVNLTYISDLEIQRDFGSYAKSAPKANDILEYKTEYDAGDVPEYIYMVFRYVDRGIDFKFDVYHNTENSIDGAERVESAVVEPIGTVENEGTKIATAYEYYASINAGFDEGVHYLFCKVTAYVPGDDSVKPVTLLMGPVKLTYKEANIGFDGTGSAEDPYKLKTPEDLTRLEELVAQGKSFAGRHFQVVNDITLPDGWTPIGCTKDGGTNINNGANLNAFSGTIDGKMDNGENAKITVPAGGLPLLGYINGATVRNLNIYGERIAGAGLVNNYTGAGLSGNAITIENVKVLSGSQTLKSGLIASCGGNAYACASAGFVVTIRDCVIESGVIVGYEGNESQIGSFAGRINGTIENCTSSATVKGGSYVGGILGSRDNAMAQCVVRNSSFHGTVESSGSYAGGIVGGGYDNSTAPNGACPTILACTVDGTVKGNERVGGIFGGDGFVAQTWDNVVGSISANSFTGKVSGNKYVGAIIGYRDSLNRYDTIAGNTYSAGCGADKGIGFVKYLDTSYANPTKMDGTIVFNTANGTSGCPTVTGCAWKANHNRTDDPLGKDAAKLCQQIGGSSTPICYELTASGSYKKEYTVGEELNLTGIKLTGTWTDGTTKEVALKDVTVAGYDKNTAGDQTISLTYGAAVAYISVTVKPVSTKITVSVSIRGDSHHSDPTSNGGPHGLARGGLTTWANETNVEADTSETVWDVLQRVGQKHGITFTADSNNAYGTVYIRAVNGLGEFDNGKNSGWMYTVNGTHPEVGVGAKYVKNGDVIILHYTDDYDYEEGGNKYGKPADSSSTSAADNQAKATAVDNLISKIGTVTANSGTAINNAWNAYNALTAEQKALVKNLSTLQEATQKWNQLKADEVIKLIDKIEEPVTEKSKASIEAARKAYDGLTDAQKRLVTNTKKLTDAETAYAKLTATPEDKEKAQQVDDLIKKLTNVTLDSEKDIQAARKAYDALTDLQKLLVDNYDVLTTAETKLEMLKAMGKVSDPYINTGDYMEKLGTPGIGSIGGEWMVIGLARSGRTVPGEEDYYKTVLEYVETNIDSETNRLHKAKSTENSRIIMALTAIGRDVTNVGGHNLLQGLSDFEYVTYQGTNGTIWALLALDSGNYPAPTGGTTTRQALIDELLRVQTSDGGWAITGDKADSDMTGMALTALAPYYKKDLRVQEAIDKAVARLSEMQDADGGFSTSYGDGEMVATSESISQVVTALSALGINPDTDERFIKNGSSAIDALLRYYVNGGGFKHVMDGEVDGMGTEQAYYALTAYYRFLSGKTNLYDMTDIIDMGGDPVEAVAEPTVPATTEPTEVVQTKASYPWWILVICIFGGCGWGVAIMLIIPKFKKKD